MLPVLDTQVQAGSSLKWKRFLDAQICEDHDVSYLMSGCNTWRWDIQQRKSSLDMFRTPYLMINTDIKRVKHSWRLCYLQPPGFMKQTIEITLACSRRYLIRSCQHSHSNTRTVKVAVQTAHKPWGYWSLCCILLWAKTWC